MIRKILLFCVLLGFVLVIGCSCETKLTENEGTVVESGEITTKKTTNPTSTSQIHTILIQNNKFVPPTTDLKVGDTIEWINKDQNKHTITFEDVRLDQVLVKGDSVRYTFNEKEEARYFCRFHAGMQGNVVVE